MQSSSHNPSLKQSHHTPQPTLSASPRRKPPSPQSSQTSITNLSSFHKFFEEPRYEEDSQRGSTEASSS
ncbi:unnamed protein product [Prunus brigantina]